MAETILVTGATGTVGSEVVKQLLSAKGQKEEDIIIKAAAHSANDSTFRNLGVEVVQLDYNKPDSLSAALVGIDKLFLLTPFQSNMVDLTSNLVNEVKKAEVKYIVKQSVLGADAEPGIIPGRLHRQTEKMI
ncbi:MAG: NAD(P)H-binding protein, partial [Nitrososphaeraceae archaeon]